MPVWYYLLNRNPRKLFSQNKPTLDDVQKRIVSDLKQYGISVTHMDELFPGASLFRELHDYTYGLLEKAEVKTAKAFLRYLWDATPTLDLSNPFLKFLLKPRVLDIANSYFDMWTRFYYFTLNQTVPVPEGSEAVQSQRWHRDPEDKKMLKIFIYLNDVDEGAGPFIFARESHADGRFGHAFPQVPPKGVYPDAEEVERIIPKSAMQVNTGRAGTIIFCDTGGLHKGGYATKSDRVMFTGGFYSDASIRVLRFKYPETFKKDIASLSAPARYALTPRPRTYISLAFYKFKKGFSSIYEG